jgi:glutamyl-tRNA synthetase
MTDYFFGDDYSVEEKGAEKYLKDGEAKKILKEFSDAIEKMRDFSAKALEEKCRAMAAEKALKPAQIIHPTRVAISGKTQGAGLFEIMEALGKKRTIERMRKAAI